MKLGRRQLIIGSGLIAGASLVGCGSMTTPGTQLSAAMIEEDPALKEVASFVGQYSQDAEFRTVESKGERHCTIRATIADLSRFVESLNGERGMPFDPVLCDGSQMTFQHRDTFFVLTHTS